MKKCISFVLNVLVVVVLMTGCTFDAESRLNRTPNETSDQRIEIEFWHSMGASNGILIEKMVNKFNQSQDEIYVKAIHQGSYADADSKFLAAVSAGDAPVVAQMEIGRIGAFAASGQLMDMMTFLEEEKNLLDDFVQGLLDASYYEGELIALPHSRSLPVMYYNKDYFRKRGLNENNPPKNWSELQYAAKVLTKGDIVGYSCPLDSWYYNALMMCAGGQIYDDALQSIGFADEEGSSPLYLWKEMLAEGTMYVPSGENYNSSEACRNLFAEGAVAMIMQSSAQLKGLEKICEFEVGVAPIPVKSDRSYPAGGSNLVIFEGHSEEKQRAGWEFIKFMISPENSLIWANGTGYLPLRISSMELETYKKMLANKEMQTIIDNINYCSVIPFLPVYEETMEIISKEIQKCVLKEEYTPEESVENIKEQVEEILLKGRY